MTVLDDSLLIYNLHVSIELSVTWTSDYIELLSGDFVNPILRDVFMSQVKGSSRELATIGKFGQRHNSNKAEYSWGIEL